MKATGIVRRIDDLGRVVIPKEIRRTLRIREGDPLEIFTEQDGAVVFKKYSPMGELSEFAICICESVHKAAGSAVAVCDRDAVIAYSGSGKRDALDRHISRELQQLMENRRSVLSRDGEPLPRLCEGEASPTVTAAAPILSEGDVLGCVVILDGRDGSMPGELELKLVQTAAGFLGRQMEP
ncbi:MAG: AbrB/MazE/SpoVT family DNA-binding domain-containing protein [Clostridiales bacterium]|nr:AbrB/MazE/SpoVT family DNA-binding domain-containing protein [Candidatus Apopatocola equi]